MKKAFSIFIVMLLLTTQVGVSFATHYCGGKVFKNSIGVLGAESPTCGMLESKKENCINHSGVQGKSCCENHAVTFQTKDQYNTSSLALEHNFVFLASFTATHIYFIHLKDSLTVNTTHYDPPVLKHDIPVLIQSFLI